MPKPNNSRVLSKIEKCLRLATSSNPGEAAAAVRQAQKLMKKHGIVQEDLQLHRVKEESRSRGDTARPPEWTIDLCRLIARAFSVRLMDTVKARPHPRYSSRKQYRAEISFIGLDDAPVVAGYAYDVLYRQLSQDRKNFIADLPARMRRGEKTRLGDLYATGWLSAVERQVKNLALSPVEAELVERWITTEHPDLEEREVPEAKDIDIEDGANLFALHSGYQSGVQVALHRPVHAAAPNERISSTGT